MTISQNATMLRALLLSLFACLILFGCTPGAQEVKYEPRPKVYNSAVSLSPGATELLGSVSYNVPILGRTAACNFPPNVKGAPVVAQVKPDYEKIKSLNPGIVIYDASLYNDQDIAQIKTMGIDTFAFKAKTIDEFVEEVRQFGSLMSAEMDASTYVDKILAERKVAQANGLNPKPRVVLLMAGAGGEHYIAGTKGFHADAIRAAGGEPVGPEQDRYVPIDAEALIKLNPDMILTAGSPDAIVNDPRLKSMSAIAKLKVRGIPQDFATRMGFRVDREINMMGRALAEMSRIN